MTASFPATADAEAEYRSRQLVTYLGSKRALLGPIERAVRAVRARLGGRRLDVFEPFSGSGAVSRLLKAHAARLVVNDLEPYAAVLGRCFLANASAVDRPGLEALAAELNARVRRERLPEGFIRELYAPRDEACIQPGERVFYTVENARRLDDYRRHLEGLEGRDLLLGPLIARASVHANTAGVFKGFYKDRRTGLGRYGGSGADALGRIRGLIELEAPVLSRFEAEVHVETGDANALARRAGAFDLAYLDPPYNQHPYGSNYFMLNLLVDYRRPARVSPVSGIPEGWRRSDYNRRRRARAALERLLDDLDAPHLIISFSNEGFIPIEDMRACLERRGRVEAFEVPHPAFRGSRSFANRSTSVTEHVFWVERS
jgi:adenine-specific DNA-methyltransferase